ncbi:CRYD protein, partial [Ramphastos sulfuratus]|nr:CRYD protein [Ramphastos sulfuratus]
VDQERSHQGLAQLFLLFSSPVLKVDYDVCSNYGNWLYSAGIGNDPRDNRKFNMIKQGLDYDGNGDYVRLWVPELQGIKGADIHTPWVLSSADLSQAGVTLGETYPQPVVTAPEWSRHISRRPQGRSPHPRGRRGPTHTSVQHKDRGIDFYFSGKKDV